MRPKPITSLGDLTSDAMNARAHGERNLGMIEDALHEVGAARSIVIDENGVILAGNGVVEAAASAGIEKVQVVDADGETIIAVRRTGLSDQQKARLALYDNRTAELADWSPAILAQLQAEDLTLTKGLWTEGELTEVLRQPPDVEFKEYDESVEAEVEYLTCPSCGHKWPK